VALFGPTGGHHFLKIVVLEEPISAASASAMTLSFSCAASALRPGVLQQSDKQ
jgi:hypothetical protein